MSRLLGNGSPSSVRTERHMLSTREHAAVTASSGSLSALSSALSRSRRTVSKSKLSARAASAPMIGVALARARSWIRLPTRRSSRSSKARAALRWANTRPIEDRVVRRPHRTMLYEGKAEVYSRIGERGLIDQGAQLDVAPVAAVHVLASARPDALVSIGRADVAATCLGVSDEVDALHALECGPPVRSGSADQRFELVERKIDVVEPRKSSSRVCHRHNLKDFQVVVMVFEVYPDGSASVQDFGFRRRMNDQPISVNSTRLLPSSGPNTRYLPPNSQASGSW